VWENLLGAEECGQIRDVVRPGLGHAATGPLGGGDDLGDRRLHRRQRRHGDNGATVLFPRSHRWGKRRPGPHDRALPVVMPAGSCVFSVGTLWHGRGANATTRDRRAITAQYCQPRLRPMEAFTLSVPRDVARTVSDNIRRMLGYGIHPPFVGAVDGLHPPRLLDS